MRGTWNLDVTPDGDRHRTEELNTGGRAVSGALRGEDQGPRSSWSEVPPDDPSSSFGGMPTLRPPPEHVPDVRVDPCIGCFGCSMAVIQRPASDYRVELPYQRGLRGVRIACDEFPDPLQQRVDAVLCGLGEQLVAVLADVLPEEIGVILKSVEF